MWLPPIPSQKIQWPNFNAFTLPFLFIDFNLCCPVVALSFDFMQKKKMKEKILKLQSPSTKDSRRMTSDYGEHSRLTVIRTKNARRRRLEIRRLKCTCQTMINITITENSNNGDNDNNLLHGSKPSNGLTEISLSLSSSSKQSSSEKNDIVLACFEEKTCKKNDEVQTLMSTSHGLLSVIGRRREMEDAVKVELGFLVKGREKFDFYGVYDGHGGSRVAEECKERLHKMLVEEIVEDDKEGSGIDWGRTMERCFEKMDEEVNRGRLGEEMVGSTAVVAVVGNGKLVVANCGDSRAVLWRDGVATALSFDHKPDRPDELERVEAAGGRVVNWNGHRVLGVLATSRSIGDRYLKPFVICKPEVTVRQLMNRDEFLILASDGLWDVISNEDACRVVRRCLNGQIRRKSLNIVNENRAAEAAAVLVELAIARGSNDNISVIVVDLRKI
ncbi:probable protein phosphatase 2C 51 [Durio zibethinus]|uniref:protein-serine/threonine phosphatase n=1 Tax=Durio zibethinus TaxID=66656 RepID=A0A6P5YAI5_DURZI|nr:probable protein phosphatase 2C 51 [Durio zibethinus]